MKLHITITFLLLIFVADFAGLQAQSLAYEWGKKYSSTDPARFPTSDFNKITTDADGNVYHLVRNETGLALENPMDTIICNPINGPSVLLKYSPLGQLLWIKQASDGASKIQYADGHLYYAGAYYIGSDISFDSGIDTLIHQGHTMFFFAKMDTAANLIWSNGIGSAGTDYISSFDVATNGDIYIAAYLEFGATINTTPNGNPVNISPSNERQFFAKYNANGQYIWHNQLPTTTDMLTINEDNNNLYISYIVTDVANISGTILSPISSSTNTAGISKINSINGNVVWSKSFGNIRETQTFTAINNSGDVTVFFIAENFNIPVDYDPSSNIFMISHTALYEVANVKLSKLGNFITAGALSGGSGSQLYGINIDIDDNIYIIGRLAVEDSIDFDLTAATQNIASTQPAGFYLAKYANDNSLIYYEVSDLGYTYSISMHIDANNNIYTAGLFPVYIDMDLTAGVDSVHVTELGLLYSGHFLTKYNQNGAVGVERQVAETVKIYPNPATDKVIISQARIGETLQIIDAMGRIISRQLVYAQEFEINTNHLTNGVYFFQIGNQTHKIVIAK